MNKNQETMSTALVEYSKPKKKGKKRKVDDVEQFQSDRIKYTEVFNNMTINEFMGHFSACEANLFAEKMSKGMYQACKDVRAARNGEVEQMKNDALSALTKAMEKEKKDEQDRKQAKEEAEEERLTYGYVELFRHGGIERAIGTYQDKQGNAIKVLYNGPIYNGELHNDGKKHRRSVEDIRRNWLAS